MLNTTLISLDELVTCTGRSESWWRRNWLRQHERHGFPRKLPGLWVWPRVAVEVWASRGGQAPAPAANDNADLPPDLAEARAALEAAFGIPQGEHHAAR